MRESAAIIAHQVAGAWVMGPLDMGELERLIEQAIAQDREQELLSRYALAPDGDIELPLPEDLADQPHLAEAIGAAQRLAAYCQTFGYTCAVVKPDHTLRLLHHSPAELEVNRE